MNQTGVDQAGGPDDGTRPEAAQPPEAQRSLGAVLAGDVNTVAVAAASAVAGGYAVKRVLGKAPDAKGIKACEAHEPPEADPPE